MYFSLALFLAQIPSRLSSVKSPRISELLLLGDMQRLHHNLVNNIWFYKWTRNFNQFSPLTASKISSLKKTWNILTIRSHLGQVEPGTQRNGTIAYFHFSYTLDLICKWQKAARSTSSSEANSLSSRITYFSLKLNYLIRRMNAA